jgi:hypothetical protein
MNGGETVGGQSGVPGGDLTKDLGEASYGRRLSDKILAAFNHAYAQGRRDIADQLLQSLNLCRDLEGADRVSGALEQARLWMFYVQARDRFAAMEADGSSALEEAKRALTEAYAAWEKAREQA